MVANPRLTHFKARAYRDESREKVSVWLRAQDEHHNGYVASPKWKKVPPGYATEPTIYLDFEDAQQLLDDLWTGGFRPSRASSGSEVIQAQQEHITSLRESQNVLHRLIVLAARSELGGEHDEGDRTRRDGESNS